MTPTHPVQRRLFSCWAEYSSPCGGCQYSLQRNAGVVGGARILRLSPATMKIAHRLAPPVGGNPQDGDADPVAHRQVVRLRLV